jgi:hypothetical protein
MAVIDAAVVSVSCLDMAAALALSPMLAITDDRGSPISQQKIDYAVLNARRHLASSVVLSTMFASTGRAGMQLLGFQLQQMLVVWLLQFLLQIQTMFI